MGENKSGSKFGIGTFEGSFFKKRFNGMSRSSCCNPVNQGWTMETPNTANFSSRDFAGLSQIINKSRSNTKNRSSLINIKNIWICWSFRIKFHNKNITEQDKIINNKIKQNGIKLNKIEKIMKSLSGIEASGGAVDKLCKGVGHFDYKKWDFLLAIYNEDIPDLFVKMS